MKKILFAALALIVVMASCVKDPEYPGVSISNVSFNPAVQADVPVTVKATITSFKDFTAVLHYIVNEGDEVTVDMVTGTEKDVYVADIPGYPDGTKVKFYVVATGELVATSATMEYEVGATPVDYSVLRLNELNGNDKFIEVYNAGENPINMNGVTIYKDTDKMVWTGKTAVTVEAGAYLLLYSEDVVLDHPEIDTANYVFHSGLSAKKNVRIELKTPAGITIDDFNLVNIDANDPSLIPAPASYSLNSDGEWYYADATPGAPNVDGETKLLGLEGGVTPPAPTPDFTNIVLNELNGDTKFIEIYNKGELDLAIDGWYIMKDDKTDPVWTADATIVVPAYGYVLLYSEDVTGEGGAQAGYAENLTFHSGLSSKKTVRIALFMNDDTERDVFTRGTTGEWGQTISDVKPSSYARVPDGGDWKLADPTPGAANPAEGEDIPQD